MSGFRRSKELLIIRVRAWNKENILPQRLDFVMDLLKKNVSVVFFDIQPERKLGYYLGYLFSFLAAYPRLLFTSCDTIILENPYLVIFAPLFKVKRKKVIAEYVDYYPANLHRLKNERFFRYQVAKIVCRIFHNFVSIITTESETGRRTLRHWGVPDKKIVIQPVGIDTSKMVYSETKRNEVRTNLHILPGTLVIGYLGKMVGFYSLDNIIKAVVEIKKLTNPLQLLFVGDGPARKDLEKITLEHNIPAIFTGNVPHTEVFGYYSAMDLFIFPLNSLAIKIGEILSIGGPLLLVTRGMPEDWIQNRVNGLVANNSSPQQIQKGLATFFSLSDEEKKKIVSAQRKFAIEHLDRKIITKNYLKLL